ncbi:MAG: glucosamine-6-phosphate deaminase [Clostridium sp.]|nr:glucosamine-6-phosphate deaminase [Clostridium sp.]
MEFKIVSDYNEMSRYTAEIIKDLITKKPDAIIGLATGSTPEGLYRDLIEMYNNGEISFKKVKTVNLDEYVGLEETHPQSYRYFMNDKLFNHIDIDINNTFVPNGMEKDHEKFSKEYEDLIDSLGTMDLQILGIGSNDHIGFNEPGVELELYTHKESLTKGTIEANSRFFDCKSDMPTEAISMGIGSIFKAKRIILLASGKNKAEAIKVLQDTKISTMLPATMLKLHKDVTIIVDKEAGSLL